MIRSRAVLLAALVGSMSVGCSNVTASVAGNTTVNGEAWYVKTTTVLGLVVGSDVYYCPAPKAAGPATCTQAQMLGDDSLTGSLKAKASDVTSDVDKEVEEETDDAEQDGDAEVVDADADDGDTEEQDEEPAKKKKKKKKKKKSGNS